ncbi:SDR family NAD(P)-dependent oxidoreductase [Nonomuraea angiospora]
MPLQTAPGVPAFDLTGRLALVTGSGRGIGQAIARGYALSGARVVLNGRDTARLEAAAAALREELAPGRPPGDVQVHAFDVNLTSGFLVGRAFARHTLPRGSGKIINICSVQNHLVRATTAPYAAAKSGLGGLTRAMCAEWASAGIQVNGQVIYVDGGMTAVI